VGEPVLPTTALGLAHQQTGVSQQAELLGDHRLLKAGGLHQIPDDAGTGHQPLQDTQPGHVGKDGGGL
jgi:hypothetical protein